VRCPTLAPLPPSTPHLSLVGAALLWSGLTDDLALLTEPCLVLRASPRTAE
jgi:hypothetical protein